MVVRRLLTNALSAEPDFEIVGSASSAEIALTKLPTLKPDVMTLDIMLPGMSGLELLPIVRQQFPQMHTLIFSSATEAQAETALDALMHGATAFLLKPNSDVSLGSSMEYLQRELRDKIKQLCYRHTAQPAFAPMKPAPAFSATAKRAEVLAIGVSTGGPTALAALMAKLPHAFPLPIVIVQHMPPVFTELLAKRIRTVTGFNIVEATEGMVLEPGKAILAPGDYHMRVARSDTDTVIRLDQSPQECSCRPAVDVLFRSVADIYGGAAIATILTGMGQDGLRGSEVLVRAGAHLIAQDEASSVVWGMPGAVTNAGLAHQILPLDQIADALMQQARSAIHGGFNR